LEHHIGDHGDEGWNSKVGEDAVSECPLSNAFNAVMETNGSSERTCEGKTLNPPE
jgi:hypothetical protein